MSVENNMLSSINGTYFKRKNLNFTVSENAKIDTNLFLNASKQVVELIGKKYIQLIFLSVM